MCFGIACPVVCCFANTTSAASPAKEGAGPAGNSPHTAYWL